ncbi:hypothetical protein KY333_04075 [Candidatus Woesearchaeota archaeon]|nr:hypothetical protein [Candidatus Woesearchaeota archaeon]MBW2994015.1 hypothetical protein [Candidatus Woesearchaeota archaeon]
MKNKKAQMVGQIFVFVVAAIIFILILTYGYRAISSFLDRSEQVALIDFKSDLESSTEVIKRDYGSVRKLNLRVPDKYQELCIVDVNNCDGLEASRPLLYSACLAGSENVFLVPKQEMPIFLKDITIKDSRGFVCVPIAGGNTVLRLEGLGKSTQISEWT